MTRDEAERFEIEWIAAWNRNDVEAVVSHFDEKARFTSPRAAATVGTATVDGKDALRAYWLAAVARISSRHFTFDHAAWDPERRQLAVVYNAQIDGKTTRAVEIMRFDPAGKVVEGEALYGAVV